MLMILVALGRLNYELDWPKLDPANNHSLSDFTTSTNLNFLTGECKIEVVREHTREIGLQESRVDKLEWDLTKIIFTSSQDFAHQLHLKECINHIAEISDRAEDAGEQLELAILKSMV